MIYYYTISQLHWDDPGILLMAADAYKKTFASQQGKALKAVWFLGLGLQCMWQVISSTCLQELMCFGEIE